MAAKGLPQPPWHVEWLTQNCTGLAWLLVETTDLFMMSVLQSTPEHANLLPGQAVLCVLLKPLGKVDVYPGLGTKHILKSDSSGSPNKPQHCDLQITSEFYDYPSLTQCPRG